MTENPSILLVEDSPDDAYFFQRALRLACVPCIFAHVLNGQEAVGVLAKARDEDGRFPDIIFIDLKMPVMNGFELLEWLQQQTFASALQIVVLSGSNQQDDRQRAQALGAMDYLVKPVGSEVLAGKLRSLQKSQGVTV